MMRRPRLGAILATAVMAGVAFLPTSGAIFTDTTTNDANSFSAAVLNNVFRVTTYEIRTGEFPGTTYTLALSNTLSSDYFVVLRGGAGNGSNGGNRGPKEPATTH